MIATVFREWRVEAAVVSGDGKGTRGDGGLAALRESVEQASFNLTPQLHKPEMAGIRWVKRNERRQ